MTEGSPSSLRADLMYEYILELWPLAKALTRLDSNEDLAASMSFCSLDSKEVIFLSRDAVGFARY